MNALRGYQLKQILELLKTLNEAHSEIKRLHSRGEIPCVIQLLAECQDCAVQVGTFIERLEGDGTRAVSLLEEYCLILYEVGVGINNEDIDKSFIKRLQRQLIKIENSIKDELKPNKIEVLFLPYKASMWDSLESIWLAAKDDPQCDAYVVAVPYYDRLPGGALGSLRYEGGMYPDYVPVVDWRTYKIEERRPDVIFTHNPYDEVNYITSVHPDYYITRLKGLTDMLCYVPYFVVSDDVDDQFCACVGPMCSDKVFLQSEKIRNTYIRVFNERDKADNGAVKSGRAKEKFIASGSPKFDKIINSRAEDYTFPKDWEQLVKKPDGTRKSIVLYNTTISSILEGNERYIKKLKYVLDVFRRRSDAVLWWRPHPLNEATYQSMRPLLLKEYEDAVAKYKREGYGIYDDTSDLHRALRAASCYYGDESSLTAMYQCTGNPVMIQNVDFNGDDSPCNNLVFENLCEADGYFWFSPSTFNALFRMDMNTWKTEYMGSFPGEKIDLPEQYMSSLFADGKIYFAPYAANEVASYDLKTREFKKLGFDLGKNSHDFLVKYDAGSKFCQVFSFGQFLYLFPRTYPGILEINIKSGESKIISDWIKPLEGLISEPSLGYFSRGVFTGGKIMAACIGANAVMEFDPNTRSSKIHKLPGYNRGYVGIAFDGLHYWLLPVSKGPVIRWDANSGASNEYSTHLDDFELDELFPFQNIIHADGGLWLLPALVGKTFLKNSKDEAFVISEALREEFGEEDIAGPQVNYTFAAELGGSIYALTEKNNRFIKYDPETERFREDAVAIASGDIGTIKALRLRAFSQDVDPADEPDSSDFNERFLRLEDLLDYLLQSGGAEDVSPLKEKRAALRKKAISHPDGTAGDAIYAICKREALET